MTRRLSTYNSKRDFSKTREPSGNGKSRRRKKNAPRFVIQKHAASHLHYDFRLEIDGVLASWAVPKGPSTDPRDKRLAIRTEDHPLAYADFEGTIPKGEYGGGTVIVWDTGTYDNLKAKDKAKGGSMEELLEKGQLEVFLHGKKLQGAYVLTRTRGRSGSKEQWLLIKMKDDHADARRNPTSTQPESVLSGKTIEDIAEEHAV
ncbi:MAG: hypothetical protein KDD44_01260 [Bdellovibrionales bacterium]|nr:hypothetical protein [Bdellovibrionales bacterium]